MAIYTGNKKAKLFTGNMKVKKAYLGTEKVYSSGNVVTYVCNGTRYTEEFDEGSSVLRPTGFTPQKPGATFLGWSTSSTSPTVQTFLIMGDYPITLYAVWNTSVTVIDNGAITSTGNSYVSTFVNTITAKPGMYNSATTTQNMLVLKQIVKSGTIYCSLYSDWYSDGGSYVYGYSYYNINGTTVLNGTRGNTIIGNKTLTNFNLISGTVFLSNSSSLSHYYASASISKVTVNLDIVG